MGTIVRDSIVPYTTARKAGWNDVDFLGSAAVYDLVVGAAQGMDGFYGMGLTEMPYVDSGVASVKNFVENYKKKFNVDPNIGAVYGYVAADLTVQGLKNAGKDLTLDSFIKGWKRSRATRTSSTARRSPSARTSARARTPRSWPRSRAASGSA